MVNLMRKLSVISADLRKREMEGRHQICFKSEKVYMKPC